MPSSYEMDVQFSNHFHKWCLLFDVISRSWLTGFAHDVFHFLYTFNTMFFAKASISVLEQIKHSLSHDGIGGFINNLSVGLPMCTDVKADSDSLKDLLSRVFAKAGEEEKPSISFSLQNIQNWSCQMFVDCLMTVIWGHFKAQDQDKPIFVELCNPKADEYRAAQFRCLSAVTEMEKDVGE